MQNETNNTVPNSGETICESDTDGNPCMSCQKSSLLQATGGQFLAQSLDAILITTVVDDAGDRETPVVLYANPAFLQLTEYEAVEIEGKSVAIIQPNNMRASDQEKFWKPFQSTQPQRALDWPLATKTGEFIWSRVNSVNVAAAPTAPVVRYLTLHTQSTETERERQFRLMAESAYDAISLTTINREVIYLNPAAERLSGYNAQQLQATDFAARVHPQDLASVEEARKANLAGKTTTIQWRCLRRDGEVLWLETTATPVFRDEGDVDLIVCVSRDITERIQAQERQRLLEKQLSHARELESISVLAGGVAHDFNNLLTSILGNANLASDEIEPHSNIANYLSQIEISSKKAAELCKQLLAYAGKGQFVVEPVNVLHVVQQLSSLMHSILANRATLQTDLPETVPLIQGDPTQIGQVLLNLLDYAAESVRGKEGVVTLRISSENVDEAELVSPYFPSNNQPGEYLIVDVLNNGECLNHDTVSKIFSPFFSTQFTGRGIGLATVLGIVRSHHGVVNVSPLSPKGNHFRLFFPTLDKTQNAKSRQVSRITKHSPVEGVILVVDDDPAIRLLAQRILQKANYRILLAADGLEALALWKEHRESIVGVLLDFTMPRLNGPGTLEQIRQIDPHLPVIFMSGFNYADIVDAKLADQANGFIKKPFTFEDIVTALNQVLA